MILPASGKHVAFLFKQNSAENKLASLFSEFQNVVKKFADYVGKEFDISIGFRNYRLIPIYHPSPLNPKGYKDNIPIFDKLKLTLLKK